MGGWEGVGFIQKSDKLLCIEGMRECRPAPPLPSPPAPFQFTSLSEINSAHCSRLLHSQRWADV